MNPYNRARFFVAVMLLLAATSANAAERQGILIGTASPGGIYYPLGNAVCRLFNLQAVDRQQNVRCAAAISDGSAANVVALRRGDIDAAIVQSDVLLEANATPGASPIQAVLALHDEPFTIVVASESAIKSSADLSGARVNIGNPGSGQRFHMERVLAAMGATRASLAQATELDPAGQNAALCARQIDAIVFTVGHPNGLIQEAVRSCRGRIVPTAEAVVQTLVKQHAEYVPMPVPAGLYQTGAANVPTFGTRAILVANATVPEAIVADLVKSVAESVTDFQKLHAAFAGITLDRLADLPKGAPVHPGARAYFQSKGLSPQR